ncbi:MAG: hypothetical protein CMM87_07145 [Rickettsiales bacterium]|mgnify:CR=1 FL=1|nr:hypothetical protein [Rickettsiales bacterium]
MCDRSQFDHATIRMPEVVAAFLSSASPALKKHVLNDLAAALGPALRENETEKMIHAELYFPHLQSALSIVHNGKVTLHNKSFSRTGWTYKSIPMDEGQLQNVERFARSTVGDAFNSQGYFMPCGIGTKQLTHTMRDSTNAAGNVRTWYCSELVTHALAAAGSKELLDDLCINQLTCLHPHSVYQALVDSDITYATAPEFKLELLNYS